MRASLDLEDLTEEHPGNVLITLIGESFGHPDLGNATIFVGNFECHIESRVHNLTNCRLPAGEGKGLSLRYHHGNSHGATAATGVVFSYDAPSVHRISPDSGPTEGGTQLRRSSLPG